MADDIPLASLGQPQPTLADLLTSKLQGAVNWWQNQPSWLQQAQAIHEASNPNSLRPTDAEIDFASGMVGPGSTKNVAGKVVPAIAEGANVPLASPTIRAFHGSPHDFDKFDMSKIGTGEGAQVFGHGLYFAGAPETAEHYRSYIPNMGTNWNDPKAVAQYLLDKHGTTEAAIANTKIFPQTDQTTRDALELLKTDPATAGPRRGKMYEVNINADPEHFLDWDKPLSEQPHVVEKLQGLASSGSAPIHKMIAEGLQQPKVQLPGQMMAGTVGRQPELLREAGIPGIKYLDQGSRGVPTTNGRVQFLNGKYHIVDDFGTQAGPFDTKELAQQYLGTPKQTSNYVVFDDKLIDILKKYGLAGLLGSGAMGLGTQQQPQQ